MEHKIKKWKLLESEYIIRRPWLTARREKVQLPDGTIHPEYYVLEYPDWVNIIAETKDGRYVLVEQYRHGLGEISIELCAGCVEPGEAPVDGARRELLEETGFGGGEWELIATLSPNSSTSTKMCSWSRNQRQRTTSRHYRRHSRAPGYTRRIIPAPFRWRNKTGNDGRAFVEIFCNKGKIILPKLAAVLTFFVILPRIV